MGWAEMGPLRRRKSVTLDGNGNGSVMFEVFSANHRWLIHTLVASTSQAQTAPPYPQVVAYLGQNQQAGRSEGGSWLGNQVTMRGDIEMDAGEDLTVAFTGGVPGSVASAVIEGENYLWH
ncbi:MAG TPA: hypothetical protein VGV89_07225 [Thermoplasmata archaeon]|nr:hypothetical protein [Thermoplasmata archaeon]